MKQISEEQVEKLLHDLPKKQLIQFAISCMDRTIVLYKQMEELKGKHPPSQRYESISPIVDFIRNDLYSADKKEIRAQIRKCNDNKWLSFPKRSVSHQTLVANYYHI